MNARGRTKSAQWTLPKLEIGQEKVGRDPNQAELMIAAEDPPESDTSVLVVGRVFKEMEAMTLYERIPILHILSGVCQTYCFGEFHVYSWSQFQFCLANSSKCKVLDMRNFKLWPPMGLIAYLMVLQQSERTWANNMHQKSLLGSKIQWFLKFC